MKAIILPVTPFQQNCSILWEEEGMRAAVVDPGGEIERIMAEIERRKLKLEKIFITHAHLDHAAGTARLAALCKVTIEGPHPDDQFLIDALPGDAARYNFPPAVPFKPDRWLTDGDRVTLGREEFHVAHCPGHTPGHVVFFHATQRCAWVGDVLFAGSIGRSDLPRGNQADLIHSIRHKLFPLGDDVTFVAGHGPVSTFGKERQTNPYVADRLFKKATTPLLRGHS